MTVDEVGKESRVQKQQAGASPPIQDDLHGFFTTSAYVTAWVIAIFGTLGPIAFLRLGGPFPRNTEGVLIRIAVVIVCAWACAAAIGTLAEISRKLTRRD